jgi:NADPH2:quinone reductase
MKTCHLLAPGIVSIDIGGRHRNRGKVREAAIRGWQCVALDGLSGLRWAELAPPPAPGPGEATLSMQAVGLNYPDLLMLSGGYQFRPTLPFVPGTEGVGRVVAVGEGVAHQLLGERLLAGARSGLLAEQVTLPLSALRQVPDALSTVEAAAHTVGALTAWVALVVRGRLTAGEHLLVLGAGGGMGLSAVALGAALGAEVTAVVSGGEAKQEAVLAAGASRAVLVDRAAPDLSALKGACDLLFDPVGGAMVLPALRTLRWGGRYLVIGFVGGPPVAVPTNLALLKGIEIIGVRAGEAGRRDPDAGRGHLAAVDRLAAEGRLKPHIGMRVGLAAADEAFAAMAEGRLVGKAVILVDPAADDG